MVCNNRFLVQKFFLVSVIILTLIVSFPFFSLKRFLTSLVMLSPDCFLLLFSLVSFHLRIHSSYICFKKTQNFVFNTIHSSFMGLKIKFTNQMYQVLLWERFLFYHVFFIKFIYIIYGYVNWCKKYLFYFFFLNFIFLFINCLFF